MKTIKKHGMHMKEKIIQFEKSDRKGKKYKVIVKNIETGKTRTIHFGGLGYQQFRDSTPLGLYSQLNHGETRRKQRYYTRHSGGIKKKNAAVKREIKLSGGLYNPKILSHIYLW